MSDIDDLLTARASGADTSSIDSMLAARAAGGMQPATPMKPKPMTAGGSFVQGVTDLPVGLGQFAEHVAETPLNAVRTAIRGSLNAVGAHDSASLFAPVTTSDFDNIVQKREQDYQAARQAAVAPTLTSLITGEKPQPGIDWWRLGGQAANPLNYLTPGGAAASAAGRIGQAAAQGAALSAAQPADIPGNFWWDKAKGATVGAAAGGLTAGVIEGAMPLLRMGVKAAKGALGGAQNASQTMAADAVVNSALAAKGIDPKSIDLNVLAGMKQEAQSALEHDAEPSAESIANRARAESLPFPIRFTRGQATGDAGQFSKEQNLRGITGVGEPITARLTEQNAAAINNLDALGAKNAPDPVSTGSWMAGKIQSTWDQVQARKDALYSAVRNSRGQPAMMDQFTAAKDIRDALDTPQASHAWDLLPSNIQRTIGDLEDGKLPLTVAQMQSLDKVWGDAARGTDNGSVAYAINTARRILGNAPIQDDVGEEARQAYMAARQAHAQQMSLVDPKLPNDTPNPNFQPLVKAVVMDGKPPETLFQTHFMGAAPSVAGKNLAFMSKLDLTAPQQVGQTLMGEIKRLALSNASDERGTVSNAVLSSWANDPVKSARLDALLPQPASQTFHNLADSVEIAKRFPVAHAVNTSNTGSALVNAGVSIAKQGLTGQLLKRLPIVKPIAEEVAAATTKTRVQEALNPGVTLKSLLTATPTQAGRRRLAARAAVPVAVGAESAANEQ